MSEMLKAATTAVKLVVAGIGGSGKKATAVNLLKDAQGVREWCWLPNEYAINLRAGSVLMVDSVSRSSKLETTYTDNTGNAVVLKVPKRQVFLGGNLVIQAPESDPLPELVVTVTDEAVIYAARVDKKVASGLVSSEVEESF